MVVPPRDRARLERLCRYALRPPVAHDRIHLTREGQVVLDLRHRWADGTTRLVFDPIELLERLAALTPRPCINLLTRRFEASRERSVLEGVSRPAGDGRLRVGLHYRALATEVGEDLVWFWIGSHAEYDTLLGRKPAPKPLQPARRAKAGAKSKRRRPARG